MTPAKENAKATLTLYRNLPWSQKMLYKDVEGRPVDVTSWTAKLVIKDSLSIDAGVLFTFTTDDGTIVLGNGYIELLINDAGILTAFDWNQGIGHLVLKQPGEVPTVLALFAFVVQNSTTDTP